MNVLAKEQHPILDLVPHDESGNVSERWLAAEAGAIRALAKNVVRDVIEIGRHLSGVKATLPHGAWLPWLEREFAWSQQTANKFMHVHEISKLPHLGNLADSSIDISGLYLLAAPSTPEAAREEVVKLAGAGGKLTHAKVKEIVDEARGKWESEQVPIIEAKLTKEKEELQLQLQRALSIAQQAKFELDNTNDRFAGKIAVTQDDLNTQVAKVVAPLQKKILQYEKKLTALAVQEEAREAREAKKRAKPEKISFAVPPELEDAEHLFRREVVALASVLPRITPAQVIEVAVQFSKVTFQTPEKWMGRAPESARAVIKWLESFIELAEPYLSKKDDSL